MHPQQYAENPN
jgi:Ca2+-binding EF-hand superfamily protein